MAVIESTNLRIQKGTDFEEVFLISKYDMSTDTLVGVNSSDVTARIRKYPTSPYFKSFSTSVDQSQGSITISMPSNQTDSLSSGRNFFDIIIRKDNKINKVVNGTMIVEETTSLIGGTDAGTDSDGQSIFVPTSLEELLDVNVNIANKKDKYVLMYDITTNKYQLVNPDDVLSAAAATETTQPGLPAEFINTIDVDLDNKIDVDAGQF